MVAVPPDTPVTVPTVVVVDPTVATEVLSLSHKPPAVASDKVIEVVSQNNEPAPLIGPGDVLFTAATTAVLQPFVPK